MYKKNLVFAAACIGLLTVGPVMLSLGTINIYLRMKFSLDEMTISSLAALLPFGILIGSIAFGPIVDRYSYKILLIFSTLLIFLGFEGIAFTNVVELLHISFFILGLGGGIINGATTALVADISTSEKGSSLSLLHSFYGIGAIAMPFLSGFLSRFFQFNEIFAGIGLIILLPTFFYSSISFPKPKQPHGFPIKKMIDLLKDYTLLSFGLILFFEGGIESIINNWTTTYLHKRLSQGTEEILFIFTFFSLGFTITRLLMYKILKHVSYKIIFYISILLALSGIIIFIFFQSSLLYTFGIILIGLGLASIFPIILASITEIYTEFSGTALSITFFLAVVGGVAFNIIIGVISESFGIEKFPFVILLGIFCIVFVFRKIKSIQ
jgi:MFS family permease